MGCGASTSSKYAPGPDAEGPPGPQPVSPPLKHASSSLTSRKGKGFAEADKPVCFLSHCKAEGAMEARFLQTELEAKLKKKVFLDSDDLRDLSQLMDHVRESKTLLLLQTRCVLERPYCLLELVAAIDSGVPIVGVALQGTHSYEFSAAQNFLSHLDTYLDQVNPGATATLREQGVEPVDAAYKLSCSLPKIISVSLNTSGSRNQLAATVADIAESLTQAKPASLAIDKATWLKSRGEPAPLYAPTEASFASLSSLGSRTPSERSGVSAAQSASAFGGGVTQSAAGSTGIKFAVSYSSDSDTAAAVSSAYRQLAKKLGRDCAPSVIIFNYAACHNAETIASKLRALCPPSTPFFGAGSMGGVVVEGQWLSKDGFFLGMQAIYDPEGVYEFFACQLKEAGPNFLNINGLCTPNYAKLSDAEFPEFMNKREESCFADAKDAVTKAAPAGVAAAEAKGLGATPQLAIALSSTSCVESAVEGVLAGVGDRIPLAGGNCQAMGPGIPPGTPHIIASKSSTDGYIVTGNEAEGAIVGVLCWPSVHVAGAFCTGLTPERTEGLVTEMDGPYTIKKIDNEPAWEKIRKWSPAFTDADQAAALESAAAGPMAQLFQMLQKEQKAFSIMELLESFRDEAATSAPPKLNPLGVHLGTADGEDVHRIITPMVIDTEQGSISFMVKVSEGDKVSSMFGKRLDVRDRTARVAKQCVKNAGFDVDTVVGGFSFMCGMNYMLTGDTGMQTLAEKLGDALGWTPTLGMIGGPEFGTMADGKSAVGTYMYSTVVFSSVPVGVAFGSGTFASGGKVSMQVSKSGAVLHAVNEDEDDI